MIEGAMDLGLDWIVSCLAGDRIIISWSIGIILYYTRELPVLMHRARGE